MEPPDRKTSGRLLVVDDERFFQDLMAKILGEEGYEVDVAASGASAINMYRKGHHQAVIMDLVLPDIMGTEVLFRLREQDPELAVIMVTAYASMESAIQALKAGAYDYIKKPIVREDLIRSVERALERQQLAQKNQILVAQLEARLEEVKALAREKEEVFRILDEGLVIMDGTGRISDLNARAEAILGSNGRIVAGDEFSRSSFPLPEGFMESVVRAEGAPVHAMVALNVGTGRKRDVELVGVCMGQGSEGPKYLLGFRDLTGIRELERRREEFLAVVSHDLKTPLTSLKGFIELLVKGEYDTEQTLHKYLGIIDSEADRMILLINDLLDLARLESGRYSLQMERLSVSDLLAYCARSLEGYVGRKGVRMKMDIQGGGDLTISGDRKRLLQILMNLYANAIRFSPEGGLIHTLASPANGAVRLEISDEGPGIPPEECERVFEKYHQARQNQAERAKGSGLGLAIVRTIVDLHGGSVKAENRSERPGSRFVIVLPAESGGAH